MELIQRPPNCSWPGCPALALVSSGYPPVCLEHFHLASEMRPAELSPDHRKPDLCLIEEAHLVERLRSQNAGDE